MHWAGKFRGPQFEPISFKMEVRTVETVKDSKGRPMPSVVALPVTDADAQDQLAKTIRDEDAVLQAMLDNPSASMAQIAQELGWLTAKTNLPLKSKVERAIQSLKDDKLVKKHRKKWRLTNQGKEEAEEISRKNKQGFLP